MSVIESILKVAVLLLLIIAMGVLFDFLFEKVNILSQCGIYFGISLGFVIAIALELGLGHSDAKTIFQQLKRIPPVSTVILAIAFYLLIDAVMVAGVIEFLPFYSSQITELTADDRCQYVLIYSVLAGPILEEIFFRGMILSGLLKKYSLVLSIMLSSILFGLIHFIPIQIISATLSGLALAYLYYLTKSLFVSSLCHILGNVFSQIASDKIPSLLNYRALIGSDLLLLLLIFSCIPIAFLIIQKLQMIANKSRKSIS